VLSNFSFILKTKLKRLGVQKIRWLVRSKYSMELAFQKEWVKEFKQNKHKVLEYWKKHRYLDDVNKICKITKDSTVLDVGCGLSSVLHFVEGKRFGIDSLADEYLKMYEYPEGITVKKGFGEYLPFPNNNFDVVFCSNALDHVTSPKKTVKEILRVLKDNGHFVLTVEVFKDKTKRDPSHLHSFLLKDVFCLLKSGFNLRFIGTSDWIGIRRYVKGLKECSQTELIVIAEKRVKGVRPSFVIRNKRLISLIS
jgi:ubiquinone/menaquinone biosynthesis C-methylase UbiE